MESSMDLSPSSPARVTDAHKRTRAKHACRECNSRRVRCNVTERQPCSNCASSGARCEVLPSRRGRYPRRSRQPQQPRLRLGMLANGLGPTTTTTTKTVTTTGNLFFGESSPLTLVSDDNNGRSASARKPRVEMVPVADQDRKMESAGISPATMRYLRDEGALTIPDLGSCLPAIEAYFKFSYPCYPIVDRAEVTQGLASMEISLLLLQGILFVGSMYCDDEAIAAMGFRDRWQARTTLYTRARLLFHAGWEKDGITLIQSIFLMSFWRGGSTDMRDVRYWLGIASTVSECYGLHRSARSMENLDMARLRKRIWWSMYVREQQTAAALGLPSRIRDENCDIEPLTPADFGSELSCVDTTFGTYTDENAVYLMKMVDISRLLGKILHSHFVPGRSPPTPAELKDLNRCLQDWKDGLPAEARHLSEEGNDTIWTCTMHLSYNYLRLLIHRHAFLRNEESEDSEVVVKAACQICRIAIDMSTRGTLRFAPALIIWSIFSALCIHTLSIRRSTGVSRRIAENRAETSLFCLRELQKYWFMKHRLLDLFIHHLDRSTVARLGESPDGQEAAADTTSEGNTNVGMALWPAERAVQDGLFEEECLNNLVNGGWEGEDGFGDLSFLLGDEGQTNGMI